MLERTDAGPETIAETVLQGIPKDVWFQEKNRAGSGVQPLCQTPISYGSGTQEYISIVLTGGSSSGRQRPLHHAEVTGHPYAPLWRPAVRRCTLRRMVVLGRSNSWASWLKLIPARHWHAA